MSESQLRLCYLCGTAVLVELFWSLSLVPQNPQKDTSGTKIRPRKVIFGHLINFAYFWVIFPLARTTFFKCKIRAEGALKSKSCQHKLALELNFLSNSKGLGLYVNFWFFTEPYWVSIENDSVYRGIHCDSVSGKNKLLSIEYCAIKDVLSHNTYWCVHCSD